MSPGRKQSMAGDSDSTNTTGGDEEFPNKLLFFFLASESDAKKWQYHIGHTVQHSIRDPRPVSSMRWAVLNAKTQNRKSRVKPRHGCPSDFRFFAPGCRRRHMNGADKVD